MKQWWIQQSARIDALSLRERAFVFLSVIACCLALADVLWLSPAMGAHQLQTQQFAAQNAELQRLRTELQNAPTPVDVNLPLRTEVAASGRISTYSSACSVRINSAPGMASA